MNFWLFVFLSVVSSSLLGAEFKHGKVISTCKTKNAKKHVYLMKQWHLAPKVNTYENPKVYPQTQSQLALFKDVDRLIGQGEVSTVFAEGCEGEIDDKFKDIFNGWSMKKLSQKLKEKDFDDVLAPVQMKLEAKHKEKVKTVCVDKTDLINKQNMSLSNARGEIGFFARIGQFRDNPKKLKIYLDAARDIFKYSEKAGFEEALKVIHQHLKKSVNTFLELLDLRNEEIAKRIEQESFKSGALIIGGAHGEGLQELFEKKNIGCTVIEPSGYNQNEAKLIESLKKFAN